MTKQTLPGETHKNQPRPLIQKIAIALIAIAVVGTIAGILTGNPLVSLGSSGLALIAAAIVTGVGGETND